MMEEDSDLEDLEWRLYSQVYHSKDANDESPLVCDSTIDIVPSVSRKQKKNLRYFENKVPQVASQSEAQIYISLDENGRHSLLEDTIAPNVHNDITLDSNSTNVVTNCDANQFHNNITVNQFTVPVILHPDGLLSSQPKNYFTWSPETLKLLPSKRHRKRLLKRHKNKTKLEKIEKQNVVEKRRQANEITIFVSDDSDDCVMVENDAHNHQPNKISTGFPKRYNESEGGAKPESDDDIIYIPPPPIEVIDIEADELERNLVILDDIPSSSVDDISKDLNGGNSLENCGKLQENEDLLKSPESATSNDFLENPSTENSSTNFNFGLHGSDFNSQGDFVRPSTKPVEYCETESSCSTNEQSRDFSNTVKTIVFDEVEFPKEDIFSDKNLESFSSFITPKRNSKLSKEISASQSPKAGVETVQNHETSSDGTSSESDYDYSSKIEGSRIPGNDPKYKNLPDLSPMVPVNETPRKGVTKKKNARNFFQSNSKVELERKSDTNENFIEPTLDTIELTKKQSKKKKKNSPKVVINSEEDEDQFLSGNGEKLNKKKSEPNHFSQVIDEGEKSIDSDKQKKKKRKSISSENLQILSDTSPEKLKKKKKRSVSVEDETLLTEVVDANIEELDESVLVTTATIVGSETCRDIRDKEDEGTVASETKKKKPSKSIPENPHPQNALDAEISKNVPDKLKKRKKKRCSTSEKLLQTEKDEDAMASTIEDTAEMKKQNEKTVSPEIIPSCSRDERKQMENEIDDILNITVIEDVEDNSDIEVILSSDSDSELKMSEATGSDMKLANCISPVESTEKNKSIIKNTCSSKILQKTDTEVFDVDDIHKIQSDDPEKWQISHKDRAMYLNMDRKKGPRCNRCRHFGHTSLKCSEKPEPPSCFLCGDPDHKEPRCPNKRCTQCGNHGDFSTSYCWKCFKFRHSMCRLCKMKGHVENTCPDLWRRYHSTTDNGPIVVVRKQVKPRNQQWCSGCARQGHLEHECNYNREYPPTTPYIMNYEDNLAQDKDRLPRFLIDNEESLEGAPRNSEDSTPNLPYAQSSPLDPQTAASLLIPSQLPLCNQLPTYHQLTEPNLVPNHLSILNHLPAPDHVAFNQILNPVQLQVFSHLPVLDQLQTLAVIQNQNVVINPVNPNFVNEIPNRVLNPCSISNIGVSSSTVDFDNKYYVRNANTMIINENEIKQIILHMPISTVHDFLTKEMEELENSNIQPKLLKSKLFKFDNIIRNKKPIPAKWQREKCYWFRIINMFIFGKHRFGDGRLHVNYLKKYIAASRSAQLDDHKRRSLLSSYTYIFTYDKHKNVNYYKWINILIKKYEEGKSNKYLM